MSYRGIGNGTGAVRQEGIGGLEQYIPEKYNTKTTLEIAVH
jgi:hypothetical protein